MSWSSHNPPHPRSCGGVWGAGREHLLRRSGGKGQAEPQRTARRRRGRDLTGTEPFQPPQSPGWDLSAPPGPPCRPTGPSTRALLLAGVRRASSKFLLTLAAPVSLPAAGSVLGEERTPATSDPTQPNAALRPRVEAVGFRRPQGDLCPPRIHWDRAVPALAPQARPSRQVVPPRTSWGRPKLPSKKPVQWVPHRKLTALFPQPCTHSLFQLLAHSGGRCWPGQLLSGE